MKLTMEQIEKLYDELEEKPDFYNTEVDTLKRWAKTKNENLEGTLYYAIVAAFYLGARRGKAYEKRQQKKRFTLTPEERKQARAIATTWDHAEDMSTIMEKWDAESVARVLLDAALTEEIERQRSGSPLCGIRKEA